MVAKFLHLNKRDLRQQRRRRERERQKGNKFILVKHQLLAIVARLQHESS